MTTKFKTQLADANERLKAGKLGVTLRQRGNKLYVRAVLPPKPDSDKTKDYQQDVATGCKPQPAGLKTAEAIAKEIAGKIAGKTFDWDEYVVRKPKSDDDKTVADWFAALETDYFQRRRRTEKSQCTWDMAYRGYLRRLPQDQPLTETLLKQALLETEPDSCTRSKFCFACKALGKFAGLEVGFINDLKGTYSSLKPAPRNLPDDETIVREILSIPNPAWRWVAGMIATYGLRPHEVFHLELGNFKRLQIGADTKTGEHQVQPLRPEWVETFNLSEVRLPRVNAPNNKARGGRVSESFRRYKLSFRPYDLRHAWAVRALRYNLPTSTAAKWMGHEVEIHTKIYEAWMTEEMEAEIYSKAVARFNASQLPSIEAGDEPGENNIVPFSRNEEGHADDNTAPSTTDPSDNANALVPV
ncbi:MAG: site-specific integrase [Cyanobacteria bacterium P01_C01_bin.120]